MVAKIMAIYYLAIGLRMFFGNLDLVKMLKEFEDSSALSLVTGFIMVVLGVLLVQYHNVWVMDWTVLVTIIGWAVLIKGIIYIAHPRVLFAWGRKFVKTHHSWSLIVIALGLVFGYFGFIA